MCLNCAVFMGACGCDPCACMNGVGCDACNHTAKNPAADDSSAAPNSGAANDSGSSSAD